MTGLDFPDGITFDDARYKYVANVHGYSSMNGSVTVYAPRANGNVAPVRTIGGPSTGLSAPHDVALDSSGNSYVANAPGVNAVTVYGPGANGNVPPLRTLNIQYDVGPEDVALSTNGNIYVTTIRDCFGRHCYGTDAVLEYAPGASGHASPIAIISGSNTQLRGPLDLALDATANIYVANTTGNSLPVYAAGAHGNVAPIRTISGSNTQLNQPYSIALDASGNIYVTNPYASVPSVTVYAAGANGNVAPIRTISGSNTGLMRPYGIGVH
ncbi:MAG: hypothetical protein JOY77_01125 [Alphaproteobacteria bacterium]|nr:hypothetical protein [Alphaproteobacteria bacterium]